MRRVIVAAAIVLASLDAEAGGYTLPVHGVKPLGLGGAYVARASGADALWYNPANLGDTELSLEAALIRLQATYTRAGGDDAGKIAENDAPFLPNPMLAFVFKATDRVSLGIGAYAPWAAHLKYAEDGPQRYSLVQNHETKFLYLHLAGAVRLGDLRIGAGLQNVYSHLKQQVVASAYTGLFGWAEDPQLDVMTDLDLEDPITLTANFGVTYETGPMTFAAAVQLPFTISGEARFQERLPSSVFFDPVTIEGDRAYIEVPFPLHARAGIAWKAAHWLDLELAGSFEDWSVQQSLKIQPTAMSLNGVPAIGAYEIGPVILDRRMKDTFSIHLGGEADVGRGWLVRGGMFYETSAFDDATFSLAVPDDQKVGLAMGASWRFGSFRIDAALARIFQGTREIAGSELRQANPTNPSQAIVVANGTYESGYWLGGLSFAWQPGSAPELGKPEDTLDISVAKPAKK